MKIVINTTPLLTPLTGIGNYVSYLIKSFPLIQPDNEYIYYARGKFSEQPLVYDEDYTVKTIYKIKEKIKSIPVLGNTFRMGWVRIRRSMETLSLAREYADLYFEPSFTPLDIDAKRIIATVHDLSFLLHPEWHVSANINQRDNFLKNICRADSIVTGSQTIKKEIQDTLDIDSSIIQTIHYGVDHAIFKVFGDENKSKLQERLNLPTKFIVFVGSIEPRKNLQRLIRAYANLPPELKREYRLLLVGFKGWKNTEIFDLMSKNRDHISYLGYLPTCDLALLYNCASLMVYPSLYEGFGLPPLEAMACGAPVLLSDIPVHREIYQEAAQYCDPLNEEDMTLQLAGLLGDPPLMRALSLKGRKRADDFSWEKTAAGHLDLFQKVFQGDS